jgi:acyl carrier protein
MSTGITIDVDRVRSIVAEVLEVEVSELELTTMFVEDLGADSLRAIEILSRMEKAFSVIIPQENLARMSNVENTCIVLREAAGAGV